MEKRAQDPGTGGCDVQAYIQSMATSRVLREATIRSVIAALDFPSGSHGLDVGCGIGHNTLLLAEAVGAAGRVTGLDLSPQFLAHAGRVIEESGLSARVSFREGDARELPFDENSFAWVWSADCVGYPAREPVSQLRELARVVEPGGSVAILAWSSQQLLPGYPLLEARLNATSVGIGPFTKDMMPELHFPRALSWLREAGLQEPTARTFVGDVQAPLSADMRNALASLLDMRWEGVRDEVGVEDWQEFQRLCRPESPDFLPDLPDYYAFFTYSLFHGKVAE